MESRWRLYLEDGDTLSLLPGVPRAYLEDGKAIEIEGVKTYFGPIRLSVRSELARGRIVARLECPSDHGPRRVRIRLAHPEARRPVAVKGGRYRADEEVVLVEPFAGRADVVLEF